MRLWVGLGNPGPAHAMQRHNLGFMAIDALHAAREFGPWRARFQGLVAEGALADQKILLLKPITFMNDSGRSVGEAMRFYKLGVGDLTVFHDELDLAPFRVRVRTGGGAAGHNGIRSIAGHIGEDFRRVRLGIGHPGHKDRVTGHVLGNHAKADMDDLAHMLGAVAAEAHWLAANDDARFMSDVAMRGRP